MLTFKTIMKLGAEELGKIEHEEDGNRYVLLTARIDLATAV